EAGEAQRRREAHDRPDDLRRGEPQPVGHEAREPEYEDLRGEDGRAEQVAEGPPGRARLLGPGGRGVGGGRRAGHALTVPAAERRDGARSILVRRGETLLVIAGPRAPALLGD